MPLFLGTSRLVFTFPVKFSGTHLLPENLGVADVSEGRLVKYYNLASFP